MALERLKDKPFTITASFEAPHPPFIVPYPFYNMCKTAMLSNATRIECVHDCALRLANLESIAIALQTRPTGAFQVSRAAFRIR